MTTRTPRVRHALVGVLVVAVAGVPPAVADVLASPADATVRPVAAAPPERPPYPVRTELPEPPTDPRDASLKTGLTAYDALAPRLNDLQALSDRVGVQVIGRSVGGRELHLVTVTAPEKAAEAERQDLWRQRIVQDPSSAARDAALAAGYKLPVFVSANIHGDEWDGTDAALRLVQDYATSTDPEVLRQLSSLRIHVVLSVNPDGRVAGTRENAAGFDLNRDLITASQPESTALRNAIVRTQPVLLLDLHGYVNGTLIDPTTPPHGENYEYDLFLKHAWPNALGMEAAIDALGYTREDGVNPPQIPLRDWHEGWDDWPPIFTPQYAALHGAVAHTVELPLRINHQDYLLPETELRRRATVNTDIAGAALTASLRYAAGHRQELLADHIEVFRRGVAGEAPRPVTGPDLPPVPAEDVVQTAYPRGYVIPVGRGQRSAVAASRLVEHLLANGVEVRSALVPVTVEGTTHPAGSYVVDLRQGRRGVARAILGPGSDLSDRVSRMYDVAGWSHGLLWGADVVTVPTGAALPSTTGPVAGAAPTGGVTGGGDLVLGLDDPADLSAVNELLGAGVGVELLDDASALVPAGHARLAEDLADRWGVQFRPAPNRADGVALEPLTVAAVADGEDRFALAELGFEVRAVDESVLNRGFDWSGVDALYVGRRLSVGSLDREATADLGDFVDSGAGVVGQGVHGAELNRALDLLDVRAVSGTGEANGVVRVISRDGPVGARATDHTFVEAPVWFRQLGDEVRVDQRLAGEDVLVSGHWRATAGTGGPDAAAGQPLVVSGVDETGTGVVLFGSDPLFRAHPKGQLPLVGRALLWASTRDG